MGRKANVILSDLLDRATRGPEVFRFMGTTLDVKKLRNPSHGDLWYDASKKKEYVYIYGQWTQLVRNSVYG